MPFLTLSDADIRFTEKELVIRSYTTAETLPTTRGLGLLTEREFAAAAFDREDKMFGVCEVSSMVSVFVDEAPALDLSHIIAAVLC